MAPWFGRGRAQHKALSSLADAGGNRSSVDQSTSTEERQAICVRVLIIANE